MVWATPDTICLSRDWQLVLSGVALCSGLLEGRDPLSPAGKKVPPAGLSGSGQLGRPPGHGGLECVGGRTTGCCQGKKEQGWGLWLSCWLFWDPCVPGVHTAGGGLSLSSRKRPELPRMPSAPRITTFPPAPVTCDAVRNKCREMLAAALRTDRERLQRAPRVLR